MDSSEYITLYQYLKEGELPEDKDPETYPKYAKKFELKNDQLYLNGRKIIQRHEVEDICAVFHDDPTGAHFAFDTIYEKIKKRYFWNTMYKDIEEYCKSCDACQRRGGPKKNNILSPIAPTDLFYRWGIDIVGPLPVTERGNRYIVVAMDYFSR
jgi:Integrase zinc binding domain